MLTVEENPLVSGSSHVEELKKLFERARSEPSDINEHLDVLRNVARDCSSVLELGTRTGVSTIAFLSGLVESESVTKNLVCCDLEYDARLDRVGSIAAGANVLFEFAKGDDLKLELGKHTLFAGPADVVFIDTWHVYGQLKRELAKFEPLARKYIIMHDTTVDAHEGESVRCGWDTASQSRSSGFPEDEIRRGLAPAVEEFLRDNIGKWRAKDVYTHNNGLTILERI